MIVVGGGGGSGQYLILEAPAVPEAPEVAEVPVGTWRAREKARAVRC